MQAERFDLEFPLSGSTLDAMYDDSAGLEARQFVKAGNALTAAHGEFYIAYGA